MMDPRPHNLGKGRPLTLRVRVFRDHSEALELWCQEGANIDSAPFVRDLEGGQRYGDMDAFRYTLNFRTEPPTRI